MNNQVTTDKKTQNFPEMLKAFLPEIQRALPKHLDGDRMSRIALTAFRRNPTLAKCDPRSVFAAVIQASQLGLEPDTLGRSYLIPYAKNTKVGNVWEKSWECQFIPGWKGLVDLVSRSGQATVWTGAVYAGDKFEYRLGDDPRCDHIPGDNHGDGEPTHVYACGKVKGSDMVITEVWSITRVKLHLNRYNKVGDKHYAHENMEMYARKVVLLQVLKYMPMSADLVRAVELDNASTTGGQGLNVNDAIQGEWSPVVDVEEEPVIKEPYTDENFNKNKAGWKAAIESGKKTAADIIATVESKAPLSDVQKEEINTWTVISKKDVAVDDDFVKEMDEADKGEK